MTTAREHIIEATCELLEMQGYHATGLNQIIKESGSPKGSLYYYFPGGKEALTAEAIQHVGRMVEARIRGSLAQIDDPAKSVETFILHVAHNVELSGYRAGGPITTVAMETASSSDRLREECRIIYASWQNAFTDKLRGGGMAEERAAALAGTIIAAIEGGIILARTNRSPEPLRHVAEHMGMLVEYTLAKQ